MEFQYSYVLHVAENQWQGHIHLYGHQPLRPAQPRQCEQGALTADLNSETDALVCLFCKLPEGSLAVCRAGLLESESCWYLAQTRQADELKPTGHSRKHSANLWSERQCASLAWGHIHWDEVYLSGLSALCPVCLYQNETSSVWCPSRSILDVKCPVCVCVYLCLCLQRPVCVCVYGVWYLCVCVCSPFSPKVFHLQFFLYKDLPFCVPAPAAIPAKRGKRHISVRPLPYETASRSQESASLINLSRPAPSGFSWTWTRKELQRFLAKKQQG